MIDFPKRHRVPYDGKFRIGDFDTDPPKGSGTEAKLEAELEAVASAGSTSCSASCSPTSATRCSPCSRRWTPPARTARSARCSRA